MPLDGEAKLLTSWQEIASYLGKGVRTVQRWEYGLGLPVSRPKKSGTHIVLSSTDELDQWLAGNWSQLPDRKESPRKSASPSNVPSTIRDSGRLRQANRELVYDLRKVIKESREESESLVRIVFHSCEAKRAPADKVMHFTVRKPSRK